MRNVIPGPIFVGFDLTSGKTAYPPEPEFTLK